MYNVHHTETHISKIKKKIQFLNILNNYFKNQIIINGFAVLCSVQCQVKSLYLHEQLKGRKIEEYKYQITLFQNL